MWIIHPRIGHLSIVVAADPRTKAPSANRLMLRARSRKHLELLQRDHPTLASYPIVKSRAGLDYPFRLVCDRDALVHVFAEMAFGINWRNVKSEAHRNQKALGADFVHAMHGVHATLAKVHG
jgi:hypothetical protein